MVDHIVFYTAKDDQPYRKTGVDMDDYFSSDQFRDDFNTMLKALLLLSRKIESVSIEIRQLRIAQTTNLSNAPQMPTIFLDDDHPS